MANREAVKEIAYAVNVVNMMNDAITHTGDIIATLSEKLISDEGVTSEELQTGFNQCLGHLLNGREFNDMYIKNSNAYVREFNNEVPGGLADIHKELIADPRIIAMQDFLNMSPESREAVIKETEDNIAKVTK